MNIPFFKQSYKEMIEILKMKYGPVNGDYFCKPTCKSKNNKITRGSEGLYVHHIKEDTFVDLCQPSQALLHPWEYQQSQNLVYCNIWEHFMLHCKIMMENCNKDQPELVGFGGVFIFISAQIIDLFLTKHPKRADVAKSKEIMLQHKQDFIDLYSEMIVWALKSNTIQVKKFIKFIHDNLNITDFKAWAVSRSTIKEMFEKKGLKNPPKWFSTPYLELCNEINMAVDLKMNQMFSKILYY